MRLPLLLPPLQKSPLRTVWAMLRKAPTRLSLQLRKVWWEDVSLCNDSHDGMTEKQRHRKSLV